MEYLKNKNKGYEEVIKKYTNFIKLNIIIINSYLKNSNNYNNISNINNLIQIIKKMIYWKWSILMINKILFFILILYLILILIIIII